MKTTQVADNQQINWKPTQIIDNVIWFGLNYNYDFIDQCWSDDQCLAEVRNQFVYIHEDKGYHAYGFEKRYNVNKIDGFGSVDQLKYDLSIIKRAFNKLIKKQ